MTSHSDPSRRTSPCGGGSTRGCGKPMVWAVIDDGEGRTKKVPLDPSAPVYRIIEEGETPVVVRAHDAMVSHFKTCSKANEFSKKDD